MTLPGLVPAPSSGCLPLSGLFLKEGPLHWVEGEADPGQGVHG